MLCISKSVWCVVEEPLIVWGDENYNFKESNMKFLRFLQLHRQKSRDKMQGGKYSVGIFSWKKNKLPKNSGIELTPENLENTKINLKSYGEEDFSKRIFRQDILQNLNRNKFSWRYSDQTMKISWTLFLTSPKCYKILRQLIPLPVKSHLYQQFSTSLKQIKNQLSELAGVTHVLNNFYDQAKKVIPNSGRSKIISTLCIDSFSFRSYLGMIPKNHQTFQVKESNVEVLNNGFIFMLAPLNSKIPTKIIHVATSSNGSYNQEIKKLAKQIMKTTQESGFRIWFKATDGDAGLHDEHKSFFEKHILGVSYTTFSSLLYSVMEKLEKDEDIYIPIADPLHVFKNLRARIINHSLAITLKNDKQPAIIELKRLKEILSLGKILDDETQIGKMRDSYAVNLFTFDNLIKLLEAEYYEAVLLFFPFCCWISTIFSPNLDLELRLFFIELSFQIIFKLLQDVHELLGMDIGQRGSSNIVIFTEELYIIRILNTLVAFGIALVFGEDNIRMDSLGTHLVENAIGIARQDSNDPRWTRILTSFAHAEMRKRFSNENGLKIHVQGRLNDGGCKISNESEIKLITKPPEWRVENFVQSLFGCCKDNLKDFCKEQLNQLIKQIRNAVDDLDTHEYSINEAANALIMARIISFNK